MTLENSRAFLLSCSVFFQSQNGSNGQEGQTKNSNGSTSNSDSAEESKKVKKPIKVVPAQSNLGQTGQGVKWDPNKVMPEPYND